MKMAAEPKENKQSKGKPISTCKGCGMASKCVCDGMMGSSKKK
jgi:hypothetical protein